MKKNQHVLTILLFFAFFDIVFAQDYLIEKVNFDIKVDKIDEIKNTNKVKFDLNVKNIIKEKNISSFKIRAYCDKKMNVEVYQTGICGKSKKIILDENNLFSFLFNNKDTNVKNFSIKLKAYDESGKWLHTEKESFRWK